MVWLYEGDTSHYKHQLLWVGNPIKKSNNSGKIPIYRICDVSLQQYNKWYVYILLSIKYLKFKYIGKTISIQNMIKKHNYGVGSVSIEPLHLQLYDLIAYICGFIQKKYYYTLK